MLELLRCFYCFIHFIRIFLTFVKSKLFFCCIIYLRIYILNKVHCLVITDIDSNVRFMEVFSVSSSGVNWTLTCLFLGNQLFRVIFFSVFHDWETRLNIVLSGYLCNNVLRATVSLPVTISVFATAGSRWLTGMCCRSFWNGQLWVHLLLSNFAAEGCF